jgi:hypothetical protein
MDEQMEPTEFFEEVKRVSRETALTLAHFISEEAARQRESAEPNFDVLKAAVEVETKFLPIACDFIESAEKAIGEEFITNLTTAIDRAIKEQLSIHDSAEAVPAS